MFWDQEILPLAQGVEPSSARGSQLIGTINICFANAIGGKEGLRAPEIQLTCKNRYCVKGILSLPSKYLERRSNKMNKQQSNILPCRPRRLQGRAAVPSAAITPSRQAAGTCFLEKACLLLPSHPSKLILVPQQRWDLSQVSWQAGHQPHIPTTVTTA